MKESRFQAKLISKIKHMTDYEITVLKNDSTYHQGIPDLIVLYGPYWAMLECKASANAKHQPNQDFYIRKFNKEGFARFVSPENENEVLDDMFNYFLGGLANDI